MCLSCCINARVVLFSTCNDESVRLTTVDFPVRKCSITILCVIIREQQEVRKNVLNIKLVFCSPVHFLEIFFFSGKYLARWVRDSVGHDEGFRVN